MKKTIFGYQLKGTESQLNEMYDLLNCEDYESKKFVKYFYVWVSEGSGVFYFPKERYYAGEQSYAIALLKYGATNGSLVHESMYAGRRA